ncbi:MAG: glycosyltransferase [Acidimicrobiia bacterium]|nr:glycosyltransferase [Acidimicrobiia bacterium]
MPSRPVVVHLIGSPVRGAPRLLVRDLLATMDTSRYRPAVAFLREGGEERERFDIESMLDEFEALRVPLFLGSMERSWHVHDAGRLDRFLRDLGARILVGHLQRADMWSCALGWWGRAHYIRVFHGQYAHWSARPTQPAFALNVADRLLAARADRVVCVSPEAKALLTEKLGIPGPKVRWIRSGIDLDHYRVDTPPLARERPLTIGMVTRVIAEKGVREFVDAIAALQRDEPSLEAVIAGGGPDLDACVAHARSVGAAIEFLGHVTDVQSVLARLDVFALPSYDEGTPISLIEALAAGRIIVVSDVGGMPHVVDDARNGLVVPARDSVALEAAFRRVVEDPDFGRRLAKAALEDSNLYTVAQMGAEWNRLYAEVLAE